MPTMLIPPMSPHSLRGHWLGPCRCIYLYLTQHQWPRNHQSQSPRLFNIPILHKPLSYNVSAPPPISPRTPSAAPAQAHVPSERERERYLMEGIK